MDLFVSNIHFLVREPELELLFGKHGKVDSVVLIKDKVTRKSKGFGFIKMPNSDEANTAIINLNEFELRGRCLHVSVAEQRERKANRIDITEASEKKKSFNKMVRSQNGGKFMNKRKRNK